MNIPKPKAVLIIILVSVILVCFEYKTYGWFITRPSKKEPSQNINVTSAPNNISDISPYKITSPDGKYIFRLFPQDSANECLFQVEDRDGKKIDLGGILGVNKISCYEGMGIASSFKRWLPQDRFILDNFKGELKVIYLRGMQSIKYIYNHIIYDRFIDVDNSLKYWLFHKQNGGFAILDLDKKEIKEISGSYTSHPLYDSINNGILFIGSRKFSEDEKNFSQSFDFLSFDDFSIRNALNTEMNETPLGMGCEDEKIESKISGEIILKQGCVTTRTNKIYLNSDGRILIKL